MSEVKSALADLTKAERLFILTRSYPLFAAYYFGLSMSDFMGEMVSFSDQNRRSLILLPAGHSKSSTFCKYNIIRHVCWNPNIRIIVLMSVFEDAADYCKNVGIELATNQKLIEDFGEFYNPLNWTNSSLTVKQRQHNDPHPTLQVFGAGGKAPNWTIKGHGCDLIIADDVVTEDTANSPDTRKRQASWFRMGVQTCPRPMWPIDRRYGLKIPKGITWPKDAPYNPRPGSDLYGQIIVPGTRFNPYDLYNDLINDKTFATIHYDCWTDKDETKPLWPEFWTNEALHNERESLGLVNFNKRYRNDPMDDSEVTFHREWFMGDEGHPGCLDETRSFGELPKDDEGRPLDLFKVLGFDPASGEASRFAAFPTFMLLGMKRGGNPTQDHRYIIDSYRAQVGVESLLDIMFDGDPNLHPGFYAKYHYDVAKVEKNGFANLLLTHHRVTEAKRKGIMVEAHLTGHNKLDPVMGVKSMEAIFRDGLVSIPYRTDRDRKLAKDIIDQFVYFSFDRSGRKKSLTDYAMAFWFAELAIRRSGVSNRTYQHPKSPGQLLRNPYFDRRGESRFIANRH